METLEKNITEVKGTLKGFKANKHYDIDALELSTEDGLLVIKFPPHTAKTIMEAVNPDTEVLVAYTSESPKHDHKGDKKPKLKLQTLTPPNGAILNIANIHPDKPEPRHLPEQLKFEKFELINGKKGELVGIRSGNKLVHIHKEDDEIADLINEDSDLEIDALKRHNKGFVNENEDIVYHIRSIHINGKEYSSKK